MTRKDYELIAGVFRTHLTELAQLGDTKETADKRRAIVMVGAELSRELSKDNSAFNSARFLRACGIS